MRACERVDPRAMWGEPFERLSFERQMKLIVYSQIREAEEARRIVPVGFPKGLGS